MHRYTVRDAADMLGITTGAVRNRLSRGTLRSVKQGGTVYVLLPADTARDAEQDAADIPTDTPQALVEEMRERITDLRQQLEQANERDRENRRIIAALTQRIPAIEAPASPEPPEAPERGTDEQQGRGPIPEDASPQTPSERPWWRRMFGG
jgi:hypothetical protein